jgi:multiple sugar transport system permease protein
MVLSTAERTAQDRVLHRAAAGRAHRRDAVTGGLLVLPATLFVVVFVAIPLVFAVYISLTDWPLIGDYHFVGLGNYASIAKDGSFWHSLLYTLLYTLIVTPAILIVGYAMAAFLRSGRPGSGFFGTVFFLPYVIGLTTLSFLSLIELQPQSGMVDQILKALHLSDGLTAWLIDTVPATVMICVLVVWAASGLTMVLLRAGMQAVPDEVYEAADIDGVTGLRRELLITVPLVRRTIGLSLVLSVIGSFLAFNQFFILTGGGPGTSTTPVVLWIYQKAFADLHVGEATAASLVLVVIVALVSLFQFRMLRSDD